MSGTEMPPAIVVNIAGNVFTEIVSLEVTRDLKDIAGYFDITLVDEARLLASLVSAIGLSSENPPVKNGDPITITIGGDTVLVGWIEKPHFKWSGEKIEMRVTGRDKTGDLVDCAALPNGPTEFRGVDLLAVANTVCEPFGITVRAEVDVGAPFDRLSLHKHQTALTFLEGAARQRSVLLVSDGVGGLLLTRGGSTRGPAPLILGDGIEDVDVELDWEQRFSDYFVTQDSSRKRTGGPALDPTTVPPEDETEPEDTPATDSEAEEAAIGKMGHATDPEITRWRPTVRLTRSQSGMDTVQEQAEWMCRVARGQSDKVHFEVLEFHAGDDGALWRPNQVVEVIEPLSDISRDMLIAGVSYKLHEGGRRTRLRIAGVSAYDRINEAERRRSPRGRGARGGSSPDLIKVVP